VQIRNEIFGLAVHGVILALEYRGFDPVSVLFAQGKNLLDVIQRIVRETPSRGWPVDTAWEKADTGFDSGCVRSGKWR
jgi:hypothetical protein